MKALKLIIEREYLATIKTKAFIFTTFLTPIVMILVMGLPSLLMSIKDSDIQKVYVADETGLYRNLFESNDDYQFVDMDGDKKMADLKEEGKKYALLQITGDLSVNPKAAVFISEKQQPPKELTSYINDVLTEAVRQKKLEEYTSNINVPIEEVNKIQAIANSKDRIRINTLRIGEDGKESDTAGEATRFLGMAFTVFMFCFIIMYGSMVLQSVTEEKTNRIVEVIVSSAKPFDLMMGKIIAVALTGITQLIIWVAVIGIVVAMAASAFGIGNLQSVAADSQQMMSAFNGNQQMVDIAIGIMNVNWAQVLVCFVLYFVGGYLLYASLFAMFGSAANDSQEAQQFIMPVTIILLIAFYVGFASTNNPEGSLAFWGSVIPFTSPVVMIVRSPYEIPLWELALSVVLLFVTVILTTFLAGKIYRTGILMYGKKTNFKELFKWLKYK